MNSEYDVTFKVKNVSLARQEEIYKLLVKTLSFDEKENFYIDVTDSLGGKHDIFNLKGIAPDGTHCRECKMINCEHCHLWKRKERLNLQKKEE
jgi:hypothetical protein